jgi:hypothetical protein
LKIHTHIFLKQKGISKMKKVYTLILLSLVFATGVSAEEITVDINSKKSESVYFDVNTSDVVTVDNTNWDLAFMTGFSAAIRINDGQGVRLWHVTDATIEDYNAPLDTTGKFDVWEEQLNSDDSWAIGAFNLGLDGFSDDNPGEFGWGTYSQTIVTGTELFVIKLRNGEYKKIAINELSTGTYYFVYSDLDNQNQQSGEVDKANFAGKLNGYYDLQENKLVDREPAINAWDFEFSQYVQLVSAQAITQPYPVTGVRTGKNVKVAQLDSVDVENTPQPVDTDFSYSITTIGYDWKEFDMATFQYKIAPNRVYFVQRFKMEDQNGQTVEVPDGALHKVIFTGYSSGKFTFNLDPTPTFVSENNYDNSKFAIYPNLISKNEKLNLIYSGSDLGNASLNVYSSTGQNVYSQNIELAKDLQISNLNITNLNAGVYFIRIEKNNSVYTQKFIVQ